MDHMCRSFDYVAAGTGKWLYNGWSSSCPAGHCHHRGVGPGYSGAKSLGAVWTHAGECEAFEKGMVRNSQMILANP